MLPADPDVTRWVLERAPKAPLFRNPTADLVRNPSGRWTKAAARRVWLAACKEAGESFQPNEGLRHAFATHAVNRGVALDRTGSYLGHTERRTTQRYAKLAAAGLVDVLRPRK